MKNDSIYRKAIEKVMQDTNTIERVKAEYDTLNEFYATRGIEAENIFSTVRAMDPLLKIQAIREVRHKMGWGLKDAKDFVDFVFSTLPG